MKKMKKLTLIGCTMLMLSVFVGCEQTIDADMYTQALLDNSYKGDSSLAVEQKIATKDEAEELYNEGIDKELNSLTDGMDLSDDLKEEYRDFLVNVFKCADYRVTSVEENDGEYYVTVEAKQLKVFGPGSDAFVENVDKIDYSQYSTEEEAKEAVWSFYLESLQDAFIECEYGDTVTKTITIERTNNTYKANQSDLIELEKALVDLEDARVS